MFKFIKDKFFRSLSSLTESENTKDNIPSAPNGNKPESPEIKPQSLWKKDYKPLRQLVLWGWDNNSNPCFLILYGRHDFKSDNGTYKVLSDHVKYTSYAVFSGSNGHLPSFEAVKIIQNSDDDAPKMYYKRGLSYYWSWSADDKYMVKEFKNLAPLQHITFPYLVQPQEQYIQKIKDQRIFFEGFSPAENPNEILNLDNPKYLSLITDMLSHPSLYTRRKRLGELLALNPPKEIYAKLLDLGSAEVISGLFIELAKVSNPILLDEAKTLIESEIKWAGVSYAKGVKRCVKLYFNALNPSLKEDRINWILNSLSEMDLHLTGINGREFSPGKILDGSYYRHYAASGLLKDYYTQYDYNARQRKTIEAPKRFKAGPYTDGVKLKLIDFKNTIQESEIYGLSDAIGKIAYFLDAPRLTYYFKGNDKIKALKYFQRYVRRVIDSYAQSSPEKFIEAMKVLLSSYTKNDCVCKFSENFQFNIFIRYYLYYDFNEKPPIGWRNRHARYVWLSSDKLLKLGGRHEFRKDIWDKNLDAAAYIAVNSEVNTVIKACYYMLKDSPNAAEFIRNMQYGQLISLSLTSYEPLSQMFGKILADKLNTLSSFDPELMLALMGSPDEKMHQKAMDFFKRMNGRFSVVTTADLLLLENLDKWSELFTQNLIYIDKDQYAEFVKYISEGKFLALDKALPKDVEDALSLSTNKLQYVSKPKRLELISSLMSALYREKLPKWLGTFMEELLFSFSYEDLESLLADAVIEGSKGVPANKQIISILKSIRDKKLPSDSEIIDILGSGTSKMIKMLFDIITKNREELKERFSTLLIMFESDVTLLNTTAEEIFDSLPLPKQKKLHAMIIDSPIKRAYSLGLRKLNTIYRDLIPSEFIIQMLEHGSTDVKAYISDKIDKIINDLGSGNKDLFMYYLKTLLLLPNRASKSKERVYGVIPEFALMYKDKLDEIENILLDIGGSNVILDSERALVTLARIRMEVMQLEG